MSCRVHVYDDNSNVIYSSDIEAIIEDITKKTNSTTIAQGKNTNLGGSEYGVDLSFKESAFIYKVIVDDSNNTSSYSPSYLYPLNGNKSGTLNVILYPLPKSGSGSGFAGGNQTVDSYITQQTWSPQEKVGVRHLVAALLSLSNRELDQPLRQLQNRWETRLDGLGLPPGSIFSPLWFIP
jgi:hypothetical protein